MDISHWITQMDDKYDSAGGIGRKQEQTIVSHWISGGQIQRSSGVRDVQRLTSGDYGFGGKRY